MDDKSINARKVVGDWKTVARITGKTTEACRQAWCRKEGETYQIVRKALVVVIETRESLTPTSY